MAVTATPAVVCAGLGGGATAASQLSRSLERLLEEAALSGELRLSGRKLRELPRRARELRDTVQADLSRNRLGEVPEEVTTYVYMERLLLAHNLVRCLPESLGALHSLTYLDLSGNQLTELAREVCLLPLEVLLLSDNRLAALPKEIGRLSSLAELDAARNCLTHVPLSIGELDSLRALDLSDNRLALLPLQVTYLKLETLDVSRNCISSLPLELRHMSSLVQLRLDCNPLVSPPTTVCMRGRVHIFKYLESLASKESVSTRRAADDARRAAKHAACGGGGGGAGAGGAATLDCLRRARHVDSGYSTSDADRRSHDVVVGAEVFGGGGGALESTPTSAVGSGRSTPSTPSTLSPGAALSRAHSLSSDSALTGQRTSPEGISGSGDDKSKPAHQQTYRQYKEALRQQRQQDVYRPRGDPSSTSSPDTDSPHSQPPSPLHTPTYRSAAAAAVPAHPTVNSSTPNTSPFPTSPLLHSTPRRFQAAPHSVNGNEPYRAEENRRPVQKVVPSRNINKTNLTNGNSNGKLWERNGRVAPAGGSPRAPPGAASPDGDVYTKPASPSEPPALNSSSGARSAIPTFNGETKLLTTTVAYLKGASVKPAGGGRLTWSKEVPPDKLSFTMKREFDKQKEELELLQQLRTIIESRLKMSLPEELAPVLADGVVLCHLANHVRPRAVASVHVPSPAQPKLTMARCRRNVDNFLEACRKLGVEEEEICSPEAILCHHAESEAVGDSTAPLARTLAALLAHAPASPPPPPPRSPPRSPSHDRRAGDSHHRPLRVQTDDHNTARYRGSPTDGQSATEDGRRECRIDYFQRQVRHRSADDRLAGNFNGSGDRCFDEADEYRPNCERLYNGERLYNAVRTEREHRVLLVSPYRECDERGEDEVDSPRRRLHLRRAVMTLDIQNNLNAAAGAAHDAAHGAAHDAAHDAASPPDRRAVTLLCLGGFLLTALLLFLFPLQ